MPWAIGTVLDGYGSPGKAEGRRIRERKWGEFSVLFAGLDILRRTGAAKLAAQMAPGSIS